MSYAANTTVSSVRTKMELEALLKKHGADSFFSGWGQDKAFVAFRIERRNVRFELPIPDRNDFLRAKNRYGSRPTHVVDKHHDQAIRARWRALLLVVKAKLEAVESGITTFEAEFLAHIQLPNGETVGQWMKPQIEDAYSLGHMPLQLSSGKCHD